MIVALLNGRAGAGKTTLALHLAGAWASGGERIVLIDADPARDALRWHEARLHAGLPPRFRVLPAAPERLDRRALRRIGRRCVPSVGFHSLSRRSVKSGQEAPQSTSTPTVHGVPSGYKRESLVVG